MFLSASIFAAAVSVIPLEGVRCADMKVRADFDAYNVYEGDPVALTVDFIGNADFGSLHPPELSDVVDASVWKIDDKSAKTDTYRKARRMTYRVRPVKDGCLEFPKLTFSYRHFHTGEKVEVSTSPILVHSKKTAQIVIPEVEDAEISWPLPDGLVIDLSSSPWGSDAALTDDQLFLWRKACAATNAAAFKEFDFPEARLNEAACEILAGNWRRALSVYSSLEWEIGQTPAIERGIVAAIALKTSDPDAELPMWRQVFRPVLKHSWLGRSLYASGAIFVVVGLFFASRLLLKLIVCFVAAVIFSQSASALDPFEEIERMHERMRREAGSMRSLGFPGSERMSFNGEVMSQPEITAKLVSDKTQLTVGETFNLIVSLDLPKDCTLSGIRLNSSRTLGLSSAGPSENLSDEPGRSSDRVVKRISIPLRYDVPFKGDVTFAISGMWERKFVRGNFRSVSSSSFSANAGLLKMEVKNLEGVKAPGDYNGCVGVKFTAYQKPDVSEVETNDVVAVVVTVRCDGAFVPEDAFESELGRDQNTVVYKKLFRAAGETKTPDISFSYYDPTKKDFCRVVAEGIPLKYITSKDRETSAVVIDAPKDDKKKIVLRFAPRESAREIASTVKRADGLKITETMGEWVRVDDGEHAGWVKKGELKNE